MANIYDINDWVGYTYYFKDQDIVSYGGYFYYCTEDHLSSDTFSDNSNKFNGTITYNVQYNQNSTIKPYFFWVPTYGSAVTSEPRLKTISFGDGYEQRLNDGINNKLLNLSVKFNGRTHNQARMILHFLDARGGKESFVFEPPVPYNKNKLFVCKNWSSSNDFYNNINIECSFQEVVT